jgi:hypothetical protein
VRAQRRLPVVAATVVCALVALGAGGSAAAPAAAPLAAHQEPILGHLLLPGERVTVSYRVDTPGAGTPTGSLYLRDDADRRFRRLALKPARGGLVRATVPGAWIRGKKLLFYAVLRDPGSGRTAMVPPAGAAAPDFAFVLAKPTVVRLGVHRFGRTRAPEAVVARAAADEVGWELPPPGSGPDFGPQAFVVGADRSIWLSDGLNQRLLVWRAGRPDEIARRVRLPVFAATSDVAFGPASSVYLLRSLPPPNPRVVLDRTAASGVIWQSELAGALSTKAGDVSVNTPLRIGPDRRLYAVLSRPGSSGAERGWRPVATAAGRPIPVAAQRLLDLWPHQPVAGGRRLLAQIVSPGGRAPREARVALVDRAGRVARAWRVVSGTDVNFGNATSAVVGGDPVVVLDVARPGRIEHIVLRLGPHGARTRFSLAQAVVGDSLLADVRVGPDGKLYRLASSPTAGVVVTRYSLRPPG